MDCSNSESETYPDPDTGSSTAASTDNDDSTAIDGEDKGEEFVRKLAQQPILNLDRATDGQAIEILEFWGIDNPEELLERFGRRRIVLRHNGRIRNAQSGWLKPLYNPAGYFLRTLEAERRYG